MFTEGYIAFSIRRKDHRAGAERRAEGDGITVKFSPATAGAVAAVAMKLGWMRAMSLLAVILKG